MEGYWKEQSEKLPLRMRIQHLSIWYEDTVRWRELNVQKYGKALIWEIDKQWGDKDKEENTVTRKESSGSEWKFSNKQAGSEGGEKGNWWEGREIKQRNPRESKNQPREREGLSLRWSWMGTEYPQGMEMPDGMRKWEGEGCYMTVPSQEWKCE